MMAMMPAHASSAAECRLKSWGMKRYAVSSRPGLGPPVESSPCRLHAAVLVSWRVLLGWARWNQVAGSENHQIEPPDDK